MQVEKGVSNNDPSNTRRSFLPSSKIKPYDVRRSLGKNSSSQHGNADRHLL